MNSNAVSGLFLIPLSESALPYEGHLGTSNCLQINVESGAAIQIDCFYWWLFPHGFV